jgi:hypothetical protein
MRIARNLGRRLIRTFTTGVPLRVPSSLYALPLGLANPARIDASATVPPMDKRVWDLAFLGSGGAHLAKPWWWTASVGLTPKACSRLAAIEATTVLAKSRPTFQTLVRCGDLLGYGPPLSSAEYQSALASTKMSLCPRGNFTETFRLAEAALAGSVIVTDRLEPEWYFANAPFIQLSNWDDLPEVADQLLGDPSRLEDVGRATRAWWEQTFHPDAVAKFMAARIQANIGVDAPAR